MKRFSKRSIIRNVKRDAPRHTEESLRLLSEHNRVNCNKLLGAHVSAAGGPHNAVHEAFKLRCRSFAFFLKNQRTWKYKELTDEQVELFKDAVKKYNFKPENIVPHTSYLVNAGSPNMDALSMSRANLLEDCKRCDRLGIALLNMHPGSSLGQITTKKCIAVIADSINYVIGETDSVIIVLETMAGQGNTVGGTFQEIRDIIELVSNKSRIGVCIDTCHIFVAGYDIRNKKIYEETMTLFDEVIGFNYLKAVHLNDSNGLFDSNLDRHADINTGHLKGSFTHIMNDPRLDGIPMVLETPSGKYEEEMNLLYGMWTKQ